MMEEARRDDWHMLYVGSDIRQLIGEIERLRDSEELAWGLIANAYGGDWDQASEASGWKRAAERWRDAHRGT
jgi:hypothetical protein